MYITYVISMSSVYHNRMYCSSLHSHFVQALPCSTHTLCSRSPAGSSTLLFYLTFRSFPAFSIGSHET